MDLKPLTLATLLLATTPHMSYGFADTSPPDVSEGIALFESKQNRQAETYFTHIVKQDPSNIDAWSYLIKSQARQEKWDEAEDSLELALKKNKSQAELQHLAGQVYGQIAQNASMFSALGYAKDALKGFKTAVELDANNVEYRLGYYRFLLFAPGIAGGDKDKAKAQLNDIKSLDVKQGYIAESQYLIATEAFDLLNSHLSNIPKELTDDIDVLFNAASSYQNTEQYDKAIALYQQIAALDPSKRESDELYLQSLYQLAKTADVGKTSTELGINSINQYIELVGEQENLPPIEWANFRLANLLSHQGENQKAKQIYLALKSSTNDKKLLKAVKKKI